MGITFHCEHCDKKIQAPDGAGGRWGKCPACHNRVYIPGTDSGEELKLAPIDENEEKKLKQLMAETHKLTHNILKEKEVPADDAIKAAPVTPDEVNDETLTVSIISYLRMMADGNLEEAEQSAQYISRGGRKAKKIIDKIEDREIPEPELADIPEQVLAGLMKQLRKKI